MARLAAARRLIAIDADDANPASALAVRYQLNSPWTRYLVTCVRQEGEKADELPAIRKVPHMLAAGWHGTGSVHAELFYSPPADAFEAVLESRDLPSLDEMQQPMWVSNEPVRCIMLLDAICRSRRLPKLDDLEFLLPDEIMVVLRDLVASGEEETQVVAALLQLLAETEAGIYLERRTRRRIRWHYKRVRPSWATMDATRVAL